MKITLKMLEGACEPQRDLFSELFGEEVELTLELCIEHAAEFDWYWAAQNLLSPKSTAEYDNAISTARAAYKKASAAYNKALAAAYDNAFDSASEAFSKALAPACADYKKAIDSARAYYDKAFDSAFEVYSKASATAFFNAATMEEK